MAFERALKVDRGAFRLLVEEHGRRMFRLAYRMTGNEQDAEDVVQETFLRAYRCLDRYDSRAQFSSWLHRIAANYLLGMMGSRDALWSLYERETDSGVREALLQAMAISGDGEHVIAVARADTDPEIREAAIHALGIVGVSEQVLLSIYEKEKDPRNRAAVLEGLFRQGCVKALIRIARTEQDRGLRLEAVRLLSMTDSSEAAEFMVEILDE